MILTMVRIPKTDLRFSFARSSGAGGQNVNKTATKVVLHWSVGASQDFTEIQKEQIRKKLGTYLNNNDELVLSAERERSQMQNKEEVVRKLEQLVTQALRIPKKRVPTKPTRASKEKRLETKRRRSRIKKNRRTTLS